MKARIWKSISRGRRTLATTIAAAFLFIGAEHALTQAMEQESNPPPGGEGIEKIELRSYPLATPMTFPGDPSGEKITSFKIKGEARAGEDGSAQLSLNSSPLTFNEFGDVELTEVRPPRAITVALIRHSSENHEISLFEISSPKLQSPQKALLLLKHDDPQSGQLLIGKMRRSEPGIAGSISLSEIALLRNDRASQKIEVSQQKLRDDIVMYSPQNPRVFLKGQLGGNGTLMHNENHTGVEWRKCSIMHYATAMAFPHKPLTMEPVELADPLNQGRRLFRLAFAAPSELGEVFLVVSPAAAGPHRLIIREAGQTRRVLPLTPEGIEPWAKLQTAFSQLPLSEQNAITRISDASSTNFFHDYIIRSGHVIYISLSHDHANRETLAQLRDLPQLFDLRIKYSNVPPEVLADALSELKGVTSLELHELQYTPDLLEAIGKMPKVESLWLTNTPKTLLTNESLRRLSGGAPRLQELHLSAFGPADEGFLHLAQLPSLKKLSLNAPQASEEGLKRLRDAMPNCTARIYQLGE
ncbi:hypothetical protein I41_25790 [Lacipirellula limnantheis]|uniref:Leucine Rich repeats (2 copies) n=2 Tax=Lacipirellula limnantheis TaxID=2528024 RepID=A0A517TYD7_9BACT|nr:hypothetical protein I41_25790 [Lacipirellula limnantheis]